MQAPHEMNHAEVLTAKLNVLKTEHHDLDTAIAALVEKGTDQITTRRLKKKKLALKDQITRIEDELTPDIIA
ncbi:MAG: YdcH family protein [Planktomarina sp.]